MSRIKEYLETLQENDSGNVMGLYAAELEDCHQQLDLANIPRTGFDEKLSISQRVRHAVGLLVRHRMQGGR